MLITVYSLFIEALTETTRFLKTIVQFIKHVKKKKEIGYLLTKKRGFLKGLKVKYFWHVYKRVGRKYFLNQPSIKLSMTFVSGH